MSADFGADPPMIASCVFRVDGLECSSNSEPGFELGIPEGRHWHARLVHTIEIDGQETIEFTGF